MKRADLSNTSIIKNSDPKTLDELKTAFSDIEQFLENEKGVFYYNIISCLSQLNKNYLNRYHERNEDEINALIQTYGLDECENSDPYFGFMEEIDWSYFEDYTKEKLYHIIGLEKGQCNKDIEDFIEQLIDYSDIDVMNALYDSEVIHVAGKDIPIRWAYQKFTEFDPYAWQKIYEYYLKHWTSEIMKLKKIKYFPEYSASEKMLAYYYLDFWYER